MTKITLFGVLLLAFSLTAVPVRAAEEKLNLDNSISAEQSIQEIIEKTDSGIDTVVEQVQPEKKPGFFGRVLGAGADALESIIRKATATPAPITSKDFYCLSRNIYHEAANEPEEGMAAVGIVTLNRLNNRSYPKTLCDVVYQRSSFSAVKTVKISKNKTKEVNKTWTVCQFSWTCEAVKEPADDNPRWIASQRVAKKVITDGYEEWKKKYSTSFHYHAYYVNPGWRLNRVTRTGAHIFYDK